MSVPAKITLVETSRFASFVLLIAAEIIPVIIIFTVPSQSNSEHVPLIQGIVGGFVLALLLWGVLYAGKTRITLDADTRTVKIVNYYVLDMIGRAPQLYNVSDVKRVYLSPPMTNRSDWLYKIRIMFEVQEPNGNLKSFSVSGINNNWSNAGKWDLVQKYHSWKAEHIH